MKPPYNKTSSQNLFHCCIVDWVTKDPNRDKHFAKHSQQATSLTSFFWSLDNRASVQRKQAEGFSLLHCSAYVTSGLKSHKCSKMQKWKYHLFYPQNVLPEGSYVSSAFSSSLGFVLQCFFSQQNKELLCKKRPLGPARLSPGGLSFQNKCFSAVHFTTMFPLLKYQAPTRSHAICFDSVI